MVNVQGSAPDLVGLELTAGCATLWAPAHPSNYWPASRRPYRGVQRRQLGICFHTPEEDADDVEVTPDWFQDERADASTGYYADSDGDIYQMVRDRDFPWAQGVRPAQRVSASFPPWYDSARHRSFNSCMLSIEIEGRAATIEDSLVIGGAQWHSLVRWSGFVAHKYGIPVDRDHFVAHSELATFKSDPGAGFPWYYFMEWVGEEVDRLERRDSGADLGGVAALELRLERLAERVAALEGTHGIHAHSSPE